MPVGWMELRVWENDIPRTLPTGVRVAAKEVLLSKPFEGYRVRQGRFLSVDLMFSGPELFPRENFNSFL